MARKNIEVKKETVNEKLSRLVESYGCSKENLDHIKADCDKINKEIKDTMRDNNVSEYTAGGFKVKYIVSERETMNEVQLIEILETKYKELSNNLGMVKMKPYVDFDVIEKEVYNGNIPQDMLLDIGKCKETKEVISIKLSKEKK